MAASWTDEKTYKLMISGAKTLLKLCWKAAEGTKIVFLKISQEMDASGFEITGQKYSGKIKKLKFDYRKIKYSRGKTGRGRKEWKSWMLFYDTSLLLAPSYN